MSQGYHILQQHKYRGGHTVTGRVHQLSRRSWRWHAQAPRGGWVNGKATTESECITAIRSVRLGGGHYA